MKNFIVTWYDGKKVEFYLVKYHFYLTNMGKFFFSFCFTWIVDETIIINWNFLSVFSWDDAKRWITNFVIQMLLMSCMGVEEKTFDLNGKRADSGVKIVCQLSIQTSHPAGIKHPLHKPQLSPPQTPITFPVNLITNDLKIGKSFNNDKTAS